MAKKRTLRPFYTKGDQNYEQFGRALMRRGDHAGAKEAFDTIKAGERIRTIKHARKMAHRPIGRFLKVPGPVRALIRRYFQPKG